jgi:hypothetical protein
VGGAQRAKGLDGLAAYREDQNQRSIDGLAYLREFAQLAVLGFVGPFHAVVNRRAVARYLGGSVVLSNLLGTTTGIVTPLCCYSAIPTAMALYRTGNRRGPACAFLIATPWFKRLGDGCCATVSTATAPRLFDVSDPLGKRRRGGAGICAIWSG